MSSGPQLRLTKPSLAAFDAMAGTPKSELWLGVFVSALLFDLGQMT